MIEDLIPADAILQFQANEATVVIDESLRRLRRFGTGKVALTLSLIRATATEAVRGWKGGSASELRNLLTEQLERELETALEAHAESDSMNQPQ